MISASHGWRGNFNVILYSSVHAPDESYLGGFACEYACNASSEDAEANFREAMLKLFARHFRQRSIDLGLQIYGEDFYFT